MNGGRGPAGTIWPVEEWWEGSLHVMSLDTTISSTIQLVSDYQHLHLPAQGFFQNDLWQARSAKGMNTSQAVPNSHNPQELRFLASLWNGISMRPVFAPLPRMFMWYFQFPMEMTSSLLILYWLHFPSCHVFPLSVSCTSQRKSLHSNSHLRVYFWKKTISEYVYLLHLIWPIQQFWQVESYINQELWRNVGPIFCFFFFNCIPRIAPGML